MVKPDVGKALFLYKSQLMSNEEIRSEINKVLDTLPGKTLEELLAFIRNLDERNSDSKDLWSLFQKIVKEDNNLFKRLAQ